MSSVNTDLYSSLGLRTAGSATGTDKGERAQKTDFLLLMTEQVKHQNPLNPMEGQDFLAQLAQFSVVDELGKLNTAFGDLSADLVSDQSLQAASLIGKDARVAASTGRLEDGDSLSGAAVLDKPAGALHIDIYNQAGVRVRRLELGSQTDGEIPFTWDGLKDDGTWAGAGTYSIKAEAETAAGNESLPTLVDARVESISLGSSGGLRINLAGVGPVGFSDIRSLN